jgi:pSer/pThr/pTyr-binding forkhead associated (FHA) protein
MQMQVEVRYPDGRSRTFRFTGATLLLGRGDGNHIPVDDAGVSPSHLRLLRREGRVFVEDLGSVSGTSVNDQVLPRHLPRPVALGEIIRMGRLEVRLRGETAQPPAENRLVAQQTSGPAEGVFSEVQLRPDFEELIIKRRSPEVPAGADVQLAWGKAIQTLGAALVVVAITVLVAVLLR